MAERNIDIVIFGAGIAGLWTFHRLKRMGYDVLLLEADAIGSGQTIASQGILHSGLKYAFAGQINALAKSISAMPDLWRVAMKGQGGVDLSAARMNAESQYLLIPEGFMGGLVKLVTKKALGNDVREIAPAQWPEALLESGFKGSVIYMGEPVLDVPSVLRALAEPYKECIRLIDTPGDPLGFLERHGIAAKKVIFTGAGSNHAIAKQYGHDAGLKTQARPLLMGMMRHAPTPLYAHCVGASEKPLVTVTTHQAADGELIWYLGGGVAERGKDCDASAVYDTARKAFAKYMPKVDLNGVQWAVLPIDRIEGKSETLHGDGGWMPDTPTVHKADNALYCWPTKLTFAPMLADMIVKDLNEDGIQPSQKNADWSVSGLREVGYTDAPWDKVQWTKS